MAQIQLNVNLNAKDAQSGIENLQQQLDSLSSTFGKNAKSTGNAESKLQDLRIGYNNLITTVKGLKDKYPSGTFDKILSDAQNGAKAVKGLNTNSSDFAKTAGKLGLGLKKLKGDLAETRAETEKNTDAVISHNQSIITMLPNILKWQVAMTLVMQPIQKAREAWESLNETLVKTEDTVIALQRVLDENISNGEIAGELYGIAEAYGQTFENVSTVAENFARTGMSWADTIEATKAAVLALNVAELDSTEASDGLIAILTQFGLEAADLTKVVDELNKTADNFPVTTEKILTALQRTGSSAANANMTLEETIGLITALSKATGRNGANLGTALNSLIQYSTKDGALSTFAGLSGNMEAVVSEYKKGAKSIYDVWSQLSKEINSLTEEQANKLDDYFKTEEGTRLSEELGNELGDIYGKLQGVYTTANTFRKNYFIALLKDFDTANQASETALGALGYSQKENEQYLDTYTAKLNTLQSKWEEIANDSQGLLEIKKALVDAGTALLTILQWTGGLRTTLALVASLIPFIFGNKILSSMKSFVASLKAAKTEAGALGATLNSVLGWIGLAVTAISAIVGAIQQYRQAQHEARQEAINAWEQEKESAEKLQSLYTKYNATIEENGERNEEFYEIEQEIVSLLGKKAQYLDGLTQGTEAYTEAVETLTEAELTKYLQDQVRARNAAKGELDSVIQQDTHLRKDQRETFTTQDIIDRYNWLLEEADTVFAENKAVIINDTDDGGYSDWTRYWEGVTEEIELLKPYVEAYQNAVEGIDTATKALNDSLDGTNDKGKQNVKTAEELKEELEAAKKEVEEAEKLQEKQNAVLEAQQKLAEAIAKAQKDYLLSIVDDYIDTLEQAATLEEKQNAILEARKDLEKAIAEAKQKALLEALKTEKQGQKDTLDLEKKRLAVEEARKKLLEAQNNLTTRVYSKAAGGFVWTANQKDIDSARVSYDQARETYNSTIEDAAWSEVEEAIENGNTDTATLKKIVNKWSAQWKGDGQPAFVESINRIIKDYEKYVPSAADIQSATDKVKTAVTSLNDYLKNQAVKEIKDYINKGNVSASGINAILAKWLDKGEGSEIKTWGSQLATQIANNAGKYNSNDSGVVSAINSLKSAQLALSDLYANSMWDEANALIVNGAVTSKAINTLVSKYTALGVSASAISRIRDILNQSGAYVPSYTKTADQDIKVSGGRIPVYDNGGVLNGLGGVKATSEDEIVLPPDIAKRILNPSTNQQFHQFLNDLGIMYGAASDRAYGRRGDIVNNATTQSSNDNRSYTVNGIPITTAAAEKYTIAEVLEMAAFAN